jgi:hypothetical protein
MVLVILGLGFDPAAALRAAVLLSTPDVPPADTQFKARAIDLYRSSESPRSPMWPASSGSARDVP